MNGCPSWWRSATRQRCATRTAAPVSSSRSKPTCCGPPNPSDTVLVFMHPIGGGSYLPMPIALARAGHHVVFCNSRYRGVDVALVMEKVVEDLGACVRHVTERLGYRARRARRLERRRGAVDVLPAAGRATRSVTSTPAGDPPDLTSLGLAPGRRRADARRPHQPPRHADRVARCVDPRRARSVGARRRARPLLAGQPEPAAVQRGVPRPLPRRPDRPQPSDHGVGQGQAGDAQGRGPRARRVRVRRPRHDGRSPLARPDGRPQRSARPAGATRAIRGS